MQEDDAALLVRFKLGEPAALAEVYDRYVGLVYRHVHYLVANDRAQAEALTERAFLEAFEAVRGSSEGRPIISWLLDIAHNLASQYMATPAWRKTEQSTEHASAHTDSREELLRALFKLTSFERQVLLLRLVDQLDYEEVARALNRSVRSVQTALYKALRRLREILKRD